MVERETLEELIVQWERIARRKLYDAKHDADPMGQQLIEHGAMCYFNCATELKAVLTSALPAPLTTQARDRTLLMRWVSTPFLLLLPK